MIKFPDINPVIISFGPFSISWYSLSYIVGIALGWYYMLKISNKSYTLLSKQHINDFIHWSIIGIIVGGRLGYVIFYNLVEYCLHPIEILKIHRGGMSFHGGLIGFAISAFIFTNKKNIKYFTIVDMASAAAPIGLFLGRIANFINSELYGRITNVSWAMVFPNSGSFDTRHPSQLYEAILEGFILFLILNYLVIKCKSLERRGLTSGVFLVFYSCFRIIIENFREPDSHLGLHKELYNMTRGQLLCLPMLVIGIILISSSYKNNDS